MKLADSSRLVRALADAIACDPDATAFEITAHGPMVLLVRVSFGPGRIHRRIGVAVSHLDDDALSRSVLAEMTTFRRLAGLGPVRTAAVGA